jgi:YHS domain-containing protein
MQVSAKSAPAPIDPVCKMTVHPSTETIEFTYEGKTYYFCAESCRKAFQDCPKKYLNLQFEKKRGWWGRYMDRLQKVTGGKPMKCH